MKTIEKYTNDFEDSFVNKGFSDSWHSFFSNSSDEMQIKSIVKFIKTLLERRDSEWISKIEDLKKTSEFCVRDYVWDNGECSRCGFNSFDDTERHSCFIYNKAINEIIRQINDLIKEYYYKNK